MLPSVIFFQTLLSRASIWFGPEMRFPIGFCAVTVSGSLRCVMAAGFGGCNAKVMSLCFLVFW